MNYEGRFHESTLYAWWVLDFLMCWKPTNGPSDLERYEWLWLLPRQNLPSWLLSQALQPSLTAIQHLYWWPEPTCLQFAKQCRAEIMKRERAVDSSEWLESAPILSILPSRKWVQGAEDKSQNQYAHRRHVFVCWMTELQELTPTFQKKQK